MSLLIKDAEVGGSQTHLRLEEGRIQAVGRALTR